MSSLNARNSSGSANFNWLRSSHMPAVLMGVSQALLATYISPTSARLTFFVLLIGILVVRPQGLFGAVERGKL